MDKEIQKSQREADKREYSNRDRRNKFTGRLKKKKFLKTSRKSRVELRQRLRNGKNVHSSLGDDETVRR